MSDTNLLPCPFCGAAPYLRDYDWPRRPAVIECDDCQIYVEGVDGTFEAARQRWNRRVTSSEAATQKDAEATAPIPDVPVVAWCYWKPGIPNGYWEFAGAPMVPSSDPLVRRVDHLAVVEKLTRERDEARAREKVLGDKYNEWFERCLVAEAEVKKLRVALSEKENSDAD